MIDFKDLEDFDEDLDELDTIEGHYGCEGYPKLEDELEEWLAKNDN